MRYSAPVMPWLAASPPRMATMKIENADPGGIAASQSVPSDVKKMPMDEALAEPAKHSAMTSEALTRTFIVPPQKMSTEVAVSKHAISGCRGETTRSEES